MSTTVFKKVDYPLSKLIDDIDMGVIGLPELQRPFVWPNINVRDMFDSMYKGFPVGYLLFWENGLTDHHRQIGTGKKQKAPSLLIVDGQQRLTSLFAVLKGMRIIRKDFREEHLYIAFRPVDHKFEVTDAAIHRDPEFIPDISQIWAVPFLRFLKNFFQRLRKSREISEEEENRLSDTIYQLHDLKSYPFTALEISSSVDEEQVSEVFVRINGKGTRLNQADFILTLMSVFWDDGRKELEDFCRKAKTPATGEASPFNYFLQPDPDQLLRVSVGLGFSRARLNYVYTILRGKDLETGELSDERRERQFALLKESQEYVLNLQNWHEFLKTLLQAGYCSGKMISSKVGLLYAYTFFLIGKRDYRLDIPTLRNIIARWFFMTALTGRYSDSPESRMEQDLARLREIHDGAGFINVLNRIVTDRFTEDYWNITLPNELATQAARSPSLFAYYAALNLLDARVLFSNLKVEKLLDPAIRANKSALERHHLFPKNYLAKLGIDDTRTTNQIANYALAEWSDNIGISDKSPAEYFPEYAARFLPEEFQQMCYWHALPDGWENMDYQEFLEARRKAMAHVIRDGFSRLQGKIV